MSRRKKDEGITAEELKKKMYQSLQSAGVLNNLKGYLRQSVINELRGRYSKNGDVTNDPDADLLAATMKRNADASWNQKAVDNLVLYHLKQSRYLYSLSLFQQESGINQYDETLTEELLLCLGASPDLLKSKSNKENRSAPSSHQTSTPVASGDNPKLLMWKILSRISSPQNLAVKIDESSVRGTRQERPKPMSLADKLQAIDDEMDGTLRERRLNDIEHRKSIATLASATRRAEEEAEKRARESFEQWKKVELASMRIKEQEKAKEQISEKTRQLENDFAQRKEALVLREKNAIERLNNQKESLEKDLHHQRQLLLHELEQIRVREKNLQEREQISRDMEASKLRETDLLNSEKFRSGFHGYQSAGLERLGRDSALSSVTESLRKSLTGKESRQLDEVLRELNSRSDEAEMLRRELVNLKEQLNVTEHQLKQMSRPEPRPSPRQREVSPRDPGGESLRKRLDDLTRQLNDWKEQDKAEKEAAIQSEISRWRTEVSKLSEARDRLDEKQRQLDELTTRVTARLSVTPRSPRPEPKRSGRLPSTSLRILMDPQNDITRDPSIRDYDPVHTGRVRWADEMPYSVRPDLIAGKKSPRSSRHQLHNLSGNSTLGLDSSTDTTSSNDLSTSGLRKDIRQTFKDLEKESEQLEQMYKRYIQSNYKHISSNTEVKRVSPRPARSSYREKSPSSKSKILIEKSRGTLEDSSKKNPEPTPLMQPTIADQSHRSTSALRQNQTTPYSPMQGPQVTPRKEAATRHSNAEKRGDILSESQGPLDLQSLEKRSGHSPPLDGGKASSRSSVTVSETSDIPESETKPMERVSASSAAEKLGKQKTGSSPESIISEKLSSSESPPQTKEKPTPTKRQNALPPIVARNRALPPISPQNNKSLVPSVSELLIGGNEGQSPSRKSFPAGKNLFGVGEAALKRGEDSESSLSSESGLPAKNTSEESSEFQQDRNKSPFERPAFLEQKKEELQRSLRQVEGEPANRDPGGSMHGKSPKHEKLSLDFQDDDDIQNILDSIDVGSARSIEEETDPKLVNLLNLLEPTAAVTPQLAPSHAELRLVSEGVDSPDSQSEDIASVGEDRQKITTDKEAPREENQEVHTYSDEEFVSSASSKSASEVKTMSDFEPSSTSIPRIEDKVTGPHESDEEDKSGADANWSNLQLDKSGELPRFKSNQDSPRVDETRENVNVDVFEDSQSEHSFEAPSEGRKKSQSSEDDFW